MTSDVREQERPAETTRSNPYAGPRALQQGEPIYGRAREINELRGAILSERIVLLYSQSGAGKTSLIEAGLRPELERRRFQVMPTIRVGYEVPVETPDANRYRLSVLTSLEAARPAEDQLTPEALASVSLKDYLHGLIEATAGLDLFLVFDQFEEIFTLDPTDWGVKEAFLHELGIAMGNRAIFALFSMREDFIAQLDPYQSTMPTRFSNTYRLELLGPSDARLAIQKPAEAAGVEFADDAAQGLVDDLRRVRVDRGPTSSLELGPSVEPVQLQVVCSQLWEHLDPKATVIRSENVDDIGNVNEALAGYYSSQVAAVAGSTHVKEKSIRNWFVEKLISDDGFRTQTRDGPDRKSDAALPELENAHLIRADRRRGTQWYELTHDRFVEPIRTSNKEFHRRRRAKLLKIVIPIGILFLMVLTGFVADRLATGPETVVEVTVFDAPAVDLDGESDLQTFDAVASQVNRFRIDGAVRSDVVALVVTATSNSPSSSGTPEVDVRLLQVGTEETAGTLAEGETKEVLPDESSADNVPTEGESSVDASGAASTTTKALPGSAGRTSSQDTVRRVEFKYSLPADGSYFIEISSSTGGPVELNYNREAGAPASQLQAGSLVEGTIDSTSPVGRYDFTANEGETVELVLDSLDPLDGILIVVDDTGFLVDSADFGGTAESEVLVTTLPAGGTYTAEVSGFDSTKGDYALEFRRPEVTPLTIGSSIEGTTLPGGRSIVYSFEASEGDTFIATMTHDDDVFPFLEVTGESGRRFGYFNGSSTESVQLWPGGDGIVVVSDPFDAPSEFTLVLDTLLTEAIGVGEPFDGNAQEGIRQTFSFEGTRQEIYDIEIVGAEAFVEVIPPGDETIVSETFIAPFDGDYLVLVEPFEAGAFTVQVVRPDLESIAFGGSAIGEAEEFGSLSYTFDAIGGDTYTVTVESESLTEFDLLLVTAPDGFLEVFEFGEPGIERLTASGTAPIDGTYLITFLADLGGTYTTMLDP